MSYFIKISQADKQVPGSCRSYIFPWQGIGPARTGRIAAAVSDADAVRMQYDTWEHSTQWSTRPRYYAAAAAAASAAATATTAAAAAV